MAALVTVMTYLELFPFCFSYTRACRSDRSETFLLLREITRRPSSRIDPDRIEEKRKWLRESVKSILQKKEKGRGGIFICSKKGANFRGETNSRATNSLRESFNRVWFHRERSRKGARERERKHGFFFSLLYSSVSSLLLVSSGAH